MSIDDQLQSETATDKLVGTLFADGAYEILSTLGSGGMSVVYKARYLPLDQLVAVKILRAQVTGGVAVQRLRQEAKLACSLDHPSIMRVFRLQIADDGCPFLVVELIEGLSLQEILRAEGTLSVERFIHIFDQVLAALSHAHAHSIIHRDIKPSNIMLTTPGDQQDIVKVVDFGIAKLLAESTAGAGSNQGQTTSGNIFGSPQYMSPEQCVGARADVRTDIYSVAVVMYEALTGKPAFQGDTALDTMYQQMHLLPPPFSQALPAGHEIPAHIESAIFCGLQKAVESRPQSIGDFRAMLHADQHSAPVRASTVAGRRVRFAKRTAFTAAAVATAFGAAAFAINYYASPETPFQATTDSAGLSILNDSSQPNSALGCLRQGEQILDNKKQLPEPERLASGTRMLERGYALLTDKTDPDVRYHLKLKLACLLNDAGNFERSRRIHLENRQESTQRTPTDRAQVDYFLAINATCRHSNKEALSFAQQAERLVDQECQQLNFKSKQSAHYAALHASSYLAQLYENDKLWAKAAPAWRKFLDHAIACESPVHLLRGYYKVAHSLHNLSKPLESKQILERFVKDDAAGKLAHPHVNTNSDRTLSYELLGIEMRLLGDPEGAQRHHEKAVECARLLTATGNERDSTVAGRLYYQGINFYACNNLEAGDRALAQSDALWRKSGFTNLIEHYASERTRYRDQALRQIAVRYKNHRSAVSEAATASSKMDLSK